MSSLPADPIEAELSRSALYRWLIAEARIMTYAIVVAVGIAISTGLLANWTRNYRIAQFGLASLIVTCGLSSILVLVNQMRFERASEEDGLLPAAEKAELKRRLVFYPGSRQALIRRLRVLAASRVEPYPKLAAIARREQIETRAARNL